jgi:opacity protein-like surface antigen
VKDDLDGVLVGAGVEVKLTPSAYRKSEYRYTDYAGGVLRTKSPPASASGSEPEEEPVARRLRHRD